MKLERMEAIYAEMGKYVVTLDSDPRSRGPAYMQELIAQCRNYINEIDRILREVHVERHHLARNLRTREAQYKLTSDDLLANDARVKALPSIQDRLATIAVIQRTDRIEIDRLKGEVDDLDTVDKVVRHQHKQLSATMADIKLQRSLIDVEVRTGAFYGDERGGRQDQGETHDEGGVSEADLAEIMAGVAAEQANADAPPVAKPTLTAQAASVGDLQDEDLSDVLAAFDASTAGV